MEINKKEILELYAVYVQTITANEQRRLQLSAFYLTLVSTGLALLGILEGMDPVFIVFPVLMISIVWFSSIKYFRQLAKAKFMVINEMENNFFLKPFGMERDNYKGKKIFKSKLLKKYGLTHLDMCIPLIIGICSSIYLAYKIIGIKLLI